MSDWTIESLKVVAGQLPPDLAIVLAGLIHVAAGDVPRLLQMLESRPALLAAINALRHPNALHQEESSLIDEERPDWLRQMAGDARVLEARGDSNGLNEAVSLWETLLDDPRLESLTSEQMAILLHESTSPLIRRCQIEGNRRDLEVATSRWNEGLNRLPKDSPLSERIRHSMEKLLLALPEIPRPANAKPEKDLTVLGAIDLVFSVGQLVVLAILLILGIVLLIGDWWHPPPKPMLDSDFFNRLLNPVQDRDHSSTER